MFVIKPYLRRSVLRYLTLKALANLLILLGLIWLGYGLSPIFASQFSFWWQQHNPDYVKAVAAYEGGFSQIAHQAPPLPEEPVNQDFAILIPAIGVNAPIQPDVPVTNKRAYFEALKKGVAHAKNTAKPSDRQGNVYLFAHSTLNPAEIEKYGAVFTLLHKLKVGQRISVFQGQVRYDYLVENREIVDGFNTKPLTRNPSEPILTLQTCDPPGLPINRLIITAKQVGVYPLK